MAYGYKNLSKAQEDAIRVMKAHGNTLIKIHGFWTYENCEFHEYHNGSNLMKFPIYNCRITTLRVLKKAPKLSEKTVKRYQDIVMRFIDHCHKSFLKVTSRLNNN